MKWTRNWGIPALLAAACLTALAGSRHDARAQTRYIPNAPQQDSILYPELKKDPRVAPHDAHNWHSRDPHAPKNEPQLWVNNDYFSIPVDAQAARLIPIVENGHLGPKTNPRGFWPQYQGGRHHLAFLELKYVLWVFPNHPRALHLLGMLARETNQKSVPIAFYEKALRLFPQRAYTRAQYGAYLVEVGETTQGILHLEEALKMDPSMLPARAWLDKARRSIGFSVGAESRPVTGQEQPTQLDGMYVPRR